MQLDHVSHCVNCGRGMHTAQSGSMGCAWGIFSHCTCIPASSLGSRMFHESCALFPQSTVANKCSCMQVQRVLPCIANNTALSSRYTTDVTVGPLARQCSCDTIHQVYATPIQTLITPTPPTIRTQTNCLTFFCHIVSSSNPNQLYSIL